MAHAIQRTPPPPYNPNAGEDGLKTNINSAKKNFPKHSKIIEKFGKGIDNASNKLKNKSRDSHQLQALHFFFRYIKKIATPKEPGSNFALHCKNSFIEAGGNNLNIKSKSIVQSAACDFYKDNKNVLGVGAICDPILQADKSASGAVAHENPDSEDDDFIFAGQNTNCVKKNPHSSDADPLFYGASPHYLYIDVSSNAGGAGGPKLDEFSKDATAAFGLNPGVKEALEKVPSPHQVADNLGNTANDVAVGFSIGRLFNSIGSGIASGISHIGSALAPVGRAVGSVLVGCYENLLTPIGHGLRAIGGGLLYILEEAAKDL
jgi:hypothetical protein